MKKLILLLFIPLVFACSSDDEDNTNPVDDTNLVDDTNPVYLDENGITIKAKDWALVGDSGIEKKTQDVLRRLKGGATKAIGMIQKDDPNFRIHNAKKQDFYDLRKKLPFELHQYFYAAIFNHEITQNAFLELSNSNYDINKIFNLINAHQDILDKKLNNTPNDMIRMMNAAKDAGAKATKIVGSGGGGCFLAMSDPKDEKKVLNSILNAGAVDAFTVNLI